MAERSPRVGDYMSDEVATVDPEDSVTAVAERDDGVYRADAGRLDFSAVAEIRARLMEARNGGGG